MFILKSYWLSNFDWFYKYSIRKSKWTDRFEFHLVQYTPQKSNLYSIEGESNLGEIYKYFYVLYRHQLTANGHTDITKDSNHTNGGTSFFHSDNYLQAATKNQKRSRDHRSRSSSHNRASRTPPPATKNGIYEMYTNRAFQDWSQVVDILLLRIFVCSKMLF